MKIIVHDWGGYPFVLELSRELARRGHAVQHIFFPPVGASKSDMERRADDPTALAIMSMQIDAPYAKHKFVRRRSQEIAYGNQLAAHIRQWQPDIVISANTPLDVQKRAIAATHRANARFIFWLQDIISVAMAGILREKLGLAGRLVAGHYRAIERQTLADSDAVVCISQDFIPILREWNIPESRCAVIENWAPKDDIRPMPKDNSWSRTKGLQDKKVFLYAGRLGLKHNPDLLLGLALAYRGNPDVAVVVVAEGLGADWLAQQRDENKLENLFLFPFQPYSDLPNVLATGDVLISIIEPSASIYSVPSKILSYLAAGRAVLAAIPKENLSARHVQRIGAGAVAPPDQPGDVIAAAKALLDDPVRLADCAERARNYAEQTFNIKTIADRFEQVIADTQLR